MAMGGDDLSWDPDQLRRQLQAMDAYDFEHLIGDLWELQGWNVDVMQQSADAGIDIRATQNSPYHRKVLIQAKRYSDDNPVSGPDVQQYSALKQQESNVDESIIITTGRFTNSAEDRAEDLNVKLIDGDGLVTMIDNFNAYDIVEGYTKHPGRDVSQSKGRQSDRLSTPQLDLPSEERAKVEAYIGQNVDEYLQEEEYRAIRAMERARGKVELNPHDAKDLGVIDDLPLYDFERSFTERKTVLVLLKDDIHINDDGEVYVEDLTNYIKSDAIRGNPSGAIIGVIKRGVQDGAWLSDQGEDIWKQKKRIRWFKQKGRTLVSAMKTKYFQQPDSPEHERIRREGSELESELTEGDSKERTITGTNPEAPVVPYETVVSEETPDQGSPNQQSRVLEKTDGAPTQEAIITENSHKHEPSIDLDFSRTTWFYGVAVGTGGWLILWVLFALLSNGGFLGGLLVLISWPLLPVAILMDARTTGVFEIAKVESVLYVFLSAIPLLALIPGAVYLYRRENTWDS